MKPNSLSGLFPNELINKIEKGGGVTGLTASAAILLICRLVIKKNSNIVVRLAKEVEAFEFYNMCFNFNNSLFVFYPPTNNKHKVPGFNTDQFRYRKESIVRFSSTGPCVCIGTNESFYERSISIKLKDSIKQFSHKVGNKKKTETVKKEIEGLGYINSFITQNPGEYSYRGDIIDVFPSHLKYPVRISFNFDEIESISYFNPKTQLTVKNLVSFKMIDYKKETQGVDNISFMEKFSPDFSYYLDVKDDCFSLFTKKEGNLFKMKIRENGFLSNKKTKRVASIKKMAASFNQIICFGESEKVFKETLNIDVDKIISGFLGCGFSFKDKSILVLSSNDVLASNNINSRWEISQENQALDPSSLFQMTVGDYIVHRVFGVGLYKGISFDNKNGSEKIEIEYKNNTKVFVSLDKVSLVHKYIGSGKNPNISTVGSSTWGSNVLKTKKEVKAVVLDIVELYSKRKMSRGFSYVNEPPIEDQIKESFNFVETPDQKVAISHVLKDMNSSKPMDRMICGDVGFGKTEVAIRAIFKAYISDRLSVFLCPTTILADQHYITCSERLAEYGVNVSLISRFQSMGKQKDIIQNLGDRKIDLLIGTHRLLSNDIKLINLGLLIIDEEHRFGVAHKEKIRKLKMGVDLLTLTATPIPRTLQQSLIGLKDISIIQTPPKSRRPILTTVQYFNWENIFSKIESELFRSGQVYFVHNNTKTIPLYVDKIRARFPNSSIEGLSGKMPSKSIENTILSFFNGQIDVLVCTTIIESGLDVTNANTLIVNDSQNFGLSQLYQIRGRVGRGARQAHCLLLIPQKKLEKDAFMRLKTIEENTLLGSGYKISTKDLEIRGSGSMFGYKQSGHISSVGFQLYCDLINKEIETVSNKGLNIDVKPRFSTSFRAGIDASYVGSQSFRLDFYYKISRVSTLNGLNKIEEDLLNIFGPIPETTENLINSSRARLLYIKTPVVNIHHKGKRVQFLLESEGLEDLSDFIKLIQSYESDFINRFNLSEKADRCLSIDFLLKSENFAFNFIFSFVDLFNSKRKI